LPAALAAAAAARLARARVGARVWAGVRVGVRVRGRVRVRVRGSTAAAARLALLFSRLLLSPVSERVPLRLARGSRPMAVQHSACR